MHNTKYGYMYIKGVADEEAAICMYYDMLNCKYHESMLQ